MRGKNSDFFFLQLYKPQEWHQDLSVHCCLLNNVDEKDQVREQSLSHQHHLLFSTEWKNENVAGGRLYDVTCNTYNINAICEEWMKLSSWFCLHKMIIQFIKQPHSPCPFSKSNLISKATINFLILSCTFMQNTYCIMGSSCHTRVLLSAFLCITSFQSCDLQHGQNVRRAGPLLSPRV